MPSFVVIGAAKAGTSALYSYLRQHPGVYLPTVEEPSWFAFAGQSLSFTGPDGKPPAINSGAITKRSEYLELFSDATEGQVSGDVSPVYLYWPGTAGRLADEVPTARVVAVLRHPVDRAYSAFMHARREGREPLAVFRDALEAEPDRIAENCGFMWRYRSMGRYAPQLEQWLSALPREQLLLTTYDEFEADAVAFCRRVQNFIGVDPEFTPNTDLRHNISGLPRSRRLYNALASENPIARVTRRLAPQKSVERLKRVQRHLRGSLIERVPLDPVVRSELVSEWNSDIAEVDGLAGLDVQHWL